MDNTRDKPTYQTLHFDQQKKKIRTEIQVGCRGFIWEVDED